MHALIKSIASDTTRFPRIQRVLSPSCRVFPRRTTGRRKLFREVYPNSANSKNFSPQNQQIGCNNTASFGHVTNFRRFVFLYDYLVMFRINQLLKPGAVISNLDDNIDIIYYAWRRYLRYLTGLNGVIHDIPAVLFLDRQIAEQEEALGLSITESAWQNPVLGCFIPFGRE